MVIAAATAAPITIRAIFQGSKCLILMAGWWILRENKNKGWRLIKDPFLFKHPTPPNKAPSTSAESSQQH